MRKAFLRCIHWLTLWMRMVPVFGKDESYEKNYLIGKYGAIPALKSIGIFRED